MLTVGWAQYSSFQVNVMPLVRFRTAFSLCCSVLFLPIALPGSTGHAAENHDAVPFFVEGQDPKPADRSWVPIAELSDEFEGDHLDDTKWSNSKQENGFGWLGRPPGLFRAENVVVSGGMMNVTVGVLPEPRTIRGQEFLYQGAIVRSKQPCAPGMYFETRMKANATEMSSTFWLISTQRRKQRQELDIQECVGRTSELTKKWARGWDQIFHSNLIRTERGKDKVQIQDSIQPPTKNHERFYVYAAWWKSPQEVLFFLDGKYAYSLKPETAWDLPAHIHMAIETYDWNPVPEGGGLIASGTEAERTTQYDWVRVWRLQ